MHDILIFNFIIGQFTQFNIKNYKTVIISMVNFLLSIRKTETAKRLFSYRLNLTNAKKRKKNTKNV